MESSQGNPLILNTNRLQPSISIYSSNMNGLDLMSSDKDSNSQRKINFNVQKQQLISRNKREEALGCKICYERSSRLKGKLIIPCKCSGSCLFAHESCIKKWIEERTNDNIYKCEICNFEYIITIEIRKIFCKKKACDWIREFSLILFVVIITFSLTGVILYLLLPNEKSKLIAISILIAMGLLLIFIGLVFKLRHCKSLCFTQRLSKWRISSINGKISGNDV